MSQNGIDVIPLFMEDGQRANSVCRESEQSREGMSCGLLDVEPEVAFREGQKQKEKNMKIRTLQIAIMAVALAGASSASAALTVAFTGVNPEEVVTLQVTGVSAFGPGGVYAGIYNLTVDGVATPSFCIDVNRESGNFSDYSYVALSSAPLSPVGPMGSDHAIAIEKLWAAYYSPSMNAQDAAALQVAIWESLGNNTLGYTVTVSGNDPVTAEAANMLASLSGLTGLADLRGLVSPSGQNYVVPVPEPTTMIAGALLLLPFGASTLRILRKKQTA
jgi:hypothetical protein